MLPFYATSKALLLCKNCPEWEPYRDCCFFAKYVLNTDLGAFPAAQAADDHYSQRNAVLKWAYDDTNHKFVVTAFGKQLACASSRLSRYASNAAPGPYCAPAAVATEDDVLHVKQLPNFGYALGQHDAELLLSYLTVPYLRVPLVVSFFAADDRIHSLQAPKLQELLDACLFEPGHHLPRAVASEVPTEVPTPQPERLGTTSGLLINELRCSPDTTLNSVIALAEQASTLDTGSPAD